VGFDEVCCCFCCCGVVGCHYFLVVLVREREGGVLGCFGERKGRRSEEGKGERRKRGERGKNVSLMYPFPLFPFFSHFSLSLLFLGELVAKTTKKEEKINFSFSQPNGKTSFKPEWS